MSGTSTEVKRYLTFLLTYDHEPAKATGTKPRLSYQLRK